MEPSKVDDQPARVLAVSCCQRGQRRQKSMRNALRRDFAVCPKSVGPGLSPPSRQKKNNNDDNSADHHPLPESRRDLDAVGAAARHCYSPPLGLGGVGGSTAGNMNAST